MTKSKKLLRIKERIEREAENQLLDAAMRRDLGFGAKELQAALRRKPRTDGDSRRE